MAIALKDAKQLAKNKLNAPLTQTELDEISAVEKSVDEVITKDFDGNQVIIPMDVTWFGNRPYAREKLMIKEFESRYKKAGWKILVENDKDGVPMQWIFGHKNTVLVPAASAPVITPTTEKAV